MTVSAAQFWQLLVESQIVSPAVAAQWRRELAADAASEAADAVKSAKWLVQRKRITAYHARVLLAGHSGPFLFGDYCILDRLTVARLVDRFRALHRATKFPLWLEFAAPQDLSRPDSIASIRDQGTRHCQVTAPSLSDCYQVAQGGHRIWLAEEAIHGRSVDSLLTKHSRLTIPQVVHIGHQVAIALVALHRAALPHGDLQTGDIWITQDRRVKLLRHPLRIVGSLDRGLGSVESQDSDLDRARYVAPELLLPGQLPTPQSDLYALGVALYRMLTGRFPWDGGDAAAVLRQQAHQQPMPLAKDLPPPLTDLVLRLLSKQPSARGPTAVEIATALGAYVGEAAWGGPSPSDPRRERYLALLQSSAQVAAIDPEQPVAPTPAAAPLIDPHRSAANLNPRKRSFRNALIATTVAGVFALVAVGGWVIHRAGSSDSSRASPRDAAETRGPHAVDRNPGPASVASGRGSQGAPADETTTETVSRNDVVPDDGSLLWASPTEGRALTLQYVPTSAKFYVAVRPAELVAHQEGRRALQALGPAFQQHVADWERQTGVPLAEIERLNLAWAPNQGQMPELVSVIWTAEPVALPSATTRTHQGQAYAWAGNLARYQPTGQDGRVTVVGPVTLVQEVIEQGNAAPILRREIGLLRQVSDASRQLTILFPPNFVFYDGRPLFGPRIGRLLGPLEDLFGDGIQAGLLSLHLGDRYDFYGELRLLGGGDLEPAETSAQLQSKLDRVPADVENFLSRHRTDDYWRLIAGRFDNMLVFFRDRLRYDTQRGQTIVNFIVPAPAAHNLLLASELTLSTSTAAAPAEPAVGPPAIQTLSQLLQQPTTLEFGQRSLEASLDELESLVRETFSNLPFDFRILIMGKDLQMAGITRNQQVKNFRQTDKTVARILTAIVMTANPVTTVQDPSETNQKLVWCLIPDPQRPARQLVAVTTRTAAGAKGYELPAEFRQK